MTNIIPIGNDHAGYELKVFIQEYLTQKGYSVKNFGCDSNNSVDYPDYGHEVANFVNSNRDMKGIIICGSGNGINMAANKHKGIRSALCWTEEIAELARLHNNANILALPARFISKDLAVKIVDAFFATEFEGGRHEKRVNKINC